MNADLSQRQRNLRRLLRPRHVAIVGGQAMADSIRRCADTGFTGEIWVVNPKYPELGGRTCYASIADLPEAPDATFIAVPREATIDILRQLSARGGGGAICYAAGYTEVGGEGVALQAEFIEAAGDLAVVGPNCYGMLNFVDGICLWPTGALGHQVETGCAIVMQSGNIALNLSRNDRSVPFAYVISSGNQAILNAADYVDALADDPKVTAIGLYLEGIKDVPAFSRAAAKALQRGKPLVALKAGNSELGAQFAMSHTGSLAGSDKMYDALFARLGIIRVHSVPQLLETLKLVSTAGLPKGDRLAVFTCSGGECLLTADLCDTLGIPLPGFSADQADDLRAQLPNFATVSNPLDYNTSLWGHEGLLVKCFSTVMRGDFDAGMLVIDFATDGPVTEEACMAAVRALLKACAMHGKMPIVTSTLSELLPAHARAEVIAAKGAPMQGLEEALNAFASVHRFAQRKAQLASAPIPVTPAAGEKRRVLSEVEGKKLLAGFGLAVPESRVVAPADAAKAAEALGFPVVLKVAEPLIAHKTEAGAVAINLKSVGDVEAALARMETSVGAYLKGGRIERVLVERMVGDVVAELIVGVQRDPQFGLALVIGAGGIMVELVEDAAMLLLPTSAEEVEATIRDLKIAKLLAGYRGKPAADMGALVKSIMAIAAFAEANRSTLLELDVNPLMVRADGAVAVDALVVFGD
ncbi:MAG TPA: acetate--CoA ligase family protein [Dongiaceae bacterium]|jgi:acyl-CoA synthetase (NDP forming)|nr:acetate--CoA ligase family protein [Dongiaceae bacterium]